MIDDMNRIVTSGTPRTPSMKPTLKIFTTGRELRRPSARRTPIGKDSRIPPTARMSVTSRPPHSVVSTVARLPDLLVPRSRTGTSTNEISQPASTMRPVMKDRLPSRYPR